ncbi:E3 ubiquitin-protein ligase TM129 isoform X2 [Galleria mellonella]|uniref:E3 ubiquitin-protein ligase TM129 isoform X2 n=1 Tax=Galleria mellonella TaxID=7137 RepID=A0A6J3BXJ0_GALME|nr:E3 ubiquitin-protein ligase TM129 isoform X2 [Galleria mellonella]
MDVLLTLFYVLFSICVIYPPTEFVSAGFTIAQLFENYLGSENTNFIGYHMKRITITALIHSTLPFGVDKVSVPLTATSKFVATETWLIKVSQYKLNIVKQEDCTLVATATDNHNLTPSGEDEIQYVNIEAIPSVDEVERFMFRMSTTALRDLQQRLAHPVRVPEHISLLPTLIERFVTVFKQHIEQNPIYYVDQEIEQCIGCMQFPADVKITRRCLAPPPHLEGGPQQCQQCNCRVLWCAACIGRWWATRAAGPQEQWLAGRCTCPVCRAPFCLLDVCPARRTPDV